MAEFLRQGAKMLNINCPQCQNPLFQLKNSDFFCPSCQKKIIWEKQEQTKNFHETANKPNLTKPQTLADNLKSKLQELSNKLADETDVHAIKDFLESIRLVIQILADLEKIQGI